MRRTAAFSPTPSCARSFRAWISSRPAEYVVENLEIRNSMNLPATTAHAPDATASL
jgi:hypothetical protein